MLAQTQRASESGTTIGVGSNILVVDDNETSLIATEAALARLGRKIEFARSGAEALARLLVQEYALIILDVSMPGLDGFDTARLLRTHERNRATPIIFVTGESWHDTTRQTGYELGAFDFLIKPVAPEVLRAKASVFIELQQRTIELQQRTLELVHKSEALREAEADAHERELAIQRERFETEALARQVDQLADADQRRNEFLAILAHELRNPLQPLRSAIELLAADPDAPVPERLRAVMDRQVRHLGRLVDDLLDLARFQTGQLELRREPVRLESIVHHVVADMSERAAKRRHELTESGAGTPVVLADPVRLTQATTNLVSNAIKFTPPGGKISVTYGVESERAFVRVTDTGRGIAHELLPRMFDMFVSERATSDGMGGFGLGLGLVRRLVELHGGSVHAASDGIDRGATFEIQLPVAAEATAPAPPVAEAIAPARPERELAARGRKLRVVVVDDSADLRELVAELLRRDGHDVTLVEDGPSAVAAIQAVKPDVALIDIGLPGIDGYEVARSVRASMPDHSVRLIALTGYGQARDRAAAAQAGFDLHIVKPARAEAIRQALADAAALDDAA